jgi:transposase
MRYHIGIDVAKDAHWVTAIDDHGQVVLDQRVENTPPALGALAEQLAHLGGERRIGLDVLGGIASRLTAMLLAAGEQLVHVPGLAVNRAREGTRGGDHQSDPRDARVIADQVRTRPGLRAVAAPEAVTVELRLLVGRRRDLVSEQTRRLARRHELLLSVHPGLERRLDLTTKTALYLLARYVTPAELRRAGRERLVRYLQRLPHARDCEALVVTALAAAAEQRVVLPAEGLTARFVRELAREALACRAQLAALDEELAATLAQHPDGALITSLPGRGVVLASECLVEAGPLTRFASGDALASAAGLTPVVRQSGRMHFLRRTQRGNRVLKRVFYPSAFCSLRDPASRAFYERKRREGKRHHQAVLALARRRVNVRWAMLAHRTPYEPRARSAVAA